MTTQMIIRIDDDLKNRLSRLARMEGKTTSVLMRELIEDYIKERDISAYIDELWGRVGDRLKSKGMKPADVDRAISTSRKKAMACHRSGSPSSKAEK